MRAVAAYALGHRVVVDYKAKLDGIGGRELAEEVLACVDEMATPMPSEVA